MPAPHTLHEVRVKRVAGWRLCHWVTRVPHTIISEAMETGASTGPHHGSGNRKRMSQSNGDAGQPEMMRRKT